MSRILIALMLAGTFVTMGTSLAVIDTDAFQTTLNKTDNPRGNKNIEAINKVRTVIFSWVKTWQDKNIDGYMSFYSSSFRSGDLDYKGWWAKKSKLFQRPGTISLQILDLWVVVEGKHAGASFVQRYQDAYHSDFGEKIINLIKLNGNWQIVMEEWQPLAR
ncbi:hypothetical protein ACFL0M_05605 [Thermodesulfobacteriota bacterium]